MLTVRRLDEVLRETATPKCRTTEAQYEAESRFWLAEWSDHPHAAAVRACPLEAAADALYNGVVWLVVEQAEAIAEAVEQMELFAEANSA